MQAGATLQQGYITVAALFGGLAAIPFLLIFAVIRERPRDPVQAEEQVSFRETLRAAWRNIPFRFATGIYMLNWMTFDLVALMLPFFLLYWVAQGNLTASVNVLGDKIVLDSVVLGLAVDHGGRCLAVVDVALAPFQQAQRLHHRDGLLGWCADAHPHWCSRDRSALSWCWLCWPD